MSRVGLKPIQLPDTVTFSKEGNVVAIKGPKGEIKIEIRPEIEVEAKDKELIVKRENDSKLAKSLHGLTRSLIANMVQGVVEGFSKSLEIQGTGYRASLEGKNLKLIVGFSHPVVIEPPEGIELKVEENKFIHVSGVNKQLVGQLAAKIRDVKKPEPYKGKGIRYQNEFVKIKPGKTVKAATEGGST